MPALPSDRRSSGPLNHGKRRELGKRRTSTSSSMPAPRSRPRKASGSWVEWPIVKMEGMAKKLGRYEEKRDFRRTPEPRGKGGRGGGTRFVVQQHDATRLHWDLRLEYEGALASWALPRGIPEHPDENRLAVHTEDHPLEYLEFAGEIPKGEYGAGSMSVWDRGTFEAEKFRENEVIATFRGERVKGRY